MLGCIYNLDAKETFVTDRSTRCVISGSNADVTDRLLTIGVTGRLIIGVIGGLIINVTGELTVSVAGGLIIDITDELVIDIFLFLACLVSNFAAIALAKLKTLSNLLEKSFSYRTLKELAALINVF
ncbi:20140_t:CDS:2 [Cetraspora pellucida]|uniref:20140_t:CDS:1 n=1 Tax=Cetraspora pellucida TaxID=1433469 RepID=A0A9N8WFN8_9GLOM|nr:20140_t:CDS:2 [Cetraspora pellucida]